MPREERSARHRVLIIDDEESTRLLLARYLSKDLKIEAQLAGTCEQALRFAGDYAYDAILLDLLMPGIGGLEVLREIRSASPNASSPSRTWSASRWAWLPRASCRARPPSARSSRAANPHDDHPATRCFQAPMSAA